MSPRRPDVFISHSDTRAFYRRRVGFIATGLAIVLITSTHGGGADKEVYVKAAPQNTSEQEYEPTPESAVPEESIWEKLGGYQPEEVDTSDMNSCELAEHERSEYVKEQTHYWGTAARQLGLQCVLDEVQIDHRA